ncbi:hypothetical protein AMS58_13695 [Pseudoalteromonas porphyrae]|uniref:Uncharacterized protein n=1 Tax=Colwellia ponticola TaxID=2304625 RepID=A0A8H2PJG4_9GAMM|nr:MULTISPECIES: ABC-three component system middle component 1 [Alteromonadales]KPH94169.1 hypothetical protein AMS58_13695 [Pseudoalteromonas porphyrae]TMM41433.1 hypothetical protein FCS21_15545 [Colwellia ponticola]
MRKILEKLLVESDFKEVSKDVFNLGTIDSFIISEYSELEIEGFFESEKTKGILEKYNENAIFNPSLKKNTSVLAYVKVQNLNDSLVRLKNTIFNIEEDEYYFRKFIFLYTDEMVASINLAHNIKSQLNIIVDSGDIDKLRENYFYDLVYYFALQLFIKLPWLSLDIEKRTFELLEGPLGRKVSEKGLDEFDLALDRIDDELMEELIEKNRSNELVNEDFQNLIKLFGSEQ